MPYNMKVFTTRLKNANITMAPATGSDIFVPAGKLTPHLHINSTFVGFKHKQGATSNLVTDSKFNVTSINSAIDIMKATNLTPNGQQVLNALIQLGQMNKFGS